MRYTYVAYNSEMALVNGVVNATSEALAEFALLERGYQPISFKLKRQLPSLGEAFPTFFGIKTGDVIVFSQQLASLLESGYAIVPSLESLRQQVGNRAFKKVIAAIIDDIRVGQSFAEALTRHPEAFKEVYCKTIRAGEQVGNLEVVLRQMAGYLEKQALAKKKAKRALVYPAALFFIALGVVALLVTVVLPPMIRMFANAGGELPLPTRILVGLTNFVTAYKLYILIAVVSVVVLALWYLKRPSGRRRFHRLLLKAPIIGPMAIATEMARFSRTMAMLLQAGLPLQDIMELVVKTTTNEETRSALKEVNSQLLQGHGLAEPMSKIDIFPKLMVDMVTVGEESGSLDSNFANMANIYEEIANDRVSAFTGVIQPALTFGISLIVGFIALSVIMPMYSILGTLD